MPALYHVIEYGHKTGFLNQHANVTEADVFYLLPSAIPAASANGGNLTAALTEVDNGGGFYQKLPPQARPLERLSLEEAEEYDHDFQAEQGVDQRVTIDLDQGEMCFEHSRSTQAVALFRDGEQPVPPEVMEPLKQARKAPVIRLKDLVLLGLPPADVYLVHGRCDVGIIPVADLQDLSDVGKVEYADLLNAKVDAIQPGAYGVELVMTGISPERLVDFDRALASLLRSGPSRGLFQAAGQEDSGTAANPPHKEDTPTEEAVRAVTDYLRFEQGTSEIWPWFLSAEEMLGDARTLREVGAGLHRDPEHGYDTEEIHQALNEAFGVNPTLECGHVQTMAPQTQM